MKHFGKIKNLKIDFLDEERFIEDLLKFEGKDIVFTISENKDFRTNSQNKLWWKYMQIIGDHLGYTKEECHDICKLKFLKRERYEDGIRVEYLKSIGVEDIAEMLEDTGWFIGDFQSALLELLKDGKVENLDAKRMRSKHAIHFKDSNGKGEYIRIKEL